MTIKLYYPEGLGAGDILPRFLKRGIVVAGGLHKDTKGVLHYFLNAIEYTADNSSFRR